MKVLTLLNEKGGVGKTTHSVHLAAGAARRNLRVLLIDADTQGHVARLLGMEKTSGLVNLTTRNAAWRQVLREPEFARWCGSGYAAGTIGALFVLPGDIETRMLPMRIDNPLALRERLHELEGWIDLVVIDTSPTPTLYQSIITLASDLILYPTLCEFLSEDGLVESMKHMRQQDEVRAGYGLPPLKMIGVLPNLYRDTNSHRFGLESLEQFFGDTLVWKPVQLRTVWADAARAQQTLYAYAPKHEATGELDALVDRLLERLALTDEASLRTGG